MASEVYAEDQHQSAVDCHLGSTEAGDSGPFLASETEPDLDPKDMDLGLPNTFKCSCPGLPSSA